MKIKSKIIYIITILSMLTVISCTKNNNKEKFKVWVEGFKNETPMNVKRTGAAGIIKNNIMYIIAGIDGADFMNTTEQSKINPDGSIDKWTASKPLNVKRGFLYAIEHNGYVYAIGGANGKNGKNLLASVERAKINEDGTLSDWTLEKHSMTSVRRCSKAVRIGKYIYAVGGYNGGFINFVERAEILPDGHLSEWVVEKNLTNIGRYIHSTAQKDEAIYIVGGHHEKEGSGLNSVEWTDIDKNGNLNKWQMKDDSLLVGRYGHNAYLYNDYLYAIGGLVGHVFIKSVESTKLDKEGTPTEWKFQTSLNVSRESTVTLVNNNNLYVVGGSNMGGFLNTVERAIFRDDGALGYWVDKKNVPNMLLSEKYVSYEDVLLNSDFNEYYNEGVTYQNLGKDDLAEDSYKKVLAINSEFKETYQNLSSIYLKQKRYTDAISFLDKAIEKFKDYPYFYYNKACAFSYLKKKDEAIASLRSAIKLGLSDLKVIEMDHDFDNIRDSMEFKEIISGK